MAQGVAFCARRLGIPATIVAPDTVPATKVQAVERMGGRVIKAPFEQWWQTFETRSYPGVQATFIHVFPVKWKSFHVAEGSIDTWTFDKDQAHATLNGGSTAEVKLKRFQGMTDEPVVLKNVKYWATPRNDGFVMSSTRWITSETGWSPLPCDTGRNRPPRGHPSAESGYCAALHLEPKPASRGQCGTARNLLPAGACECQHARLAANQPIVSKAERTILWHIARPVGGMLLVRTCFCRISGVSSALLRRFFLSSSLLYWRLLQIEGTVSRTGRSLFC